MFTNYICVNQSYIQGDYFDFCSSYAYIYTDCSITVIIAKYI